MAAEPTNAEELSVADGLFAVLLGIQARRNMPPITASVFADKGRRLHVWFDADGTGTFTDLGLTVVAAVPYALNAETLDGKDGSYYDQHYEHVIVVAKSGGDYTTVSDALDSISDNGPDSRYLVWVGPGVYTETVTMKEYVDIEGAGELLTTISYSGSSQPSPARWWEQDNAELRFLTVRNTGGNTYAIAVRNSNTSPRLTHLTISAAGGTNTSYGVYNETSSLTMINVNVSASGPGNCAGVYNTTSSAPTMTDVTASASCSSEAYRREKLHLLANHDRRDCYRLRDRQQLWRVQQLLLLAYDGGRDRLRLGRSYSYGVYSLLLLAEHDAGDRLRFGRQWLQLRRVQQFILLANHGRADCLRLGGNEELRCVQ